MKKIFSKVMAILLVMATILTVFSLPASAATVGATYKVVNTVDGSTKAKVTYNTEYYTIKNGKTIKLDAFFSNNLIGVYRSNGTKLSRDALLKQVRFDIHVYDKNGQCVNYKYCIRDDGTFR